MRMWITLLMAAVPLVGPAARGARTSQPAVAPIPAYTAYALPDPDAVRIGPNAPVRPFTRTGAQLVWFGQSHTMGDLSVTVVATLPAGTSVPLTVQVGGVTHRVTFAGSGEDRPVDFGTFAIRDTGALQVTLATVSGAPVPTLMVRALQLNGPVAAAAHFNREARRNAASVHLRYPIDSTWRITGFYSEVTAVDDPVTTYYMACGFARGYLGMQVNSATERRIIFSVWDAANGTNAVDRSTVDSSNFTQLVAKGDGVEASVFGNEGTGGHSHLVYPWKTGSTQRFYVTAAVSGSHTVYTGYWYHPERQQWQRIASFKAAKDSLGLRRLYAFSENFGGSTGHLRRKARYGAQWVQTADGQWHELTTATFSHDPTGVSARLDRFMGVEDGQFFLSHGGFGSGFTTSGTAFTRPALGRPPVIALPQ